MQSLPQTLSALAIAVPALQRAVLAAACHVGQYTWSARSSDFGPWMLCDGRELRIDEFRELYDVLGTSFGGGEDTFALPDLRGRVMGGVGRGTGLCGRSLGDAVGEERHTLTAPEMPAHLHTGTTDSSGSHTHTTNATGGSLGLAVCDGNNTVINTDPSQAELNVWTTPRALVVDSAGAHVHTFTTSTAGGDASHNNMQPTLFAGNIFIFSGIPDFVARRGP